MLGQAAFGVEDLHRPSEALRGVGSGIGDSRVRLRRHLERDDADLERVRRRCTDDHAIVTMAAAMDSDHGIVP
jgi:hypothetical protein